MNDVVESFNPIFRMLGCAFAIVIALRIFLLWRNSPKQKGKRGENPFGGGAGGGVKINPIAFLVVKEGSVRMIPVAAPANTTADRIVEMVPDTLDKIAAFLDTRIPKNEA